jgi:hypothetical protein
VTSKTDAVDLRALPAGSAVRFVTENGTYYSVTTTGDSGDEGMGVITHLKISSRSANRKHDESGEGYRGLWRIAVGETWMFETTSTKLTPPVKQIILVVSP